MFYRGTVRREMQVQMPTRRNGGLLSRVAGHVRSLQPQDALTTLRYYQPAYKVRGAKINNTNVTTL